MADLRSKKILIVEDDVSLGSSLQERLLKDYADVDWAKSKSEAFLKFKEKSFDLVILDVGLPDGTGFEVADSLKNQYIKNQFRCVFIFLTAQSDAESRLQGYELGAQEFIPKPFHLKELLLRVQHVLEDHGRSQALVLPELSIYFSEMKIVFSNGQIEYPPVKDLKVLEILIQKSPQPVSRDEILDTVWGADKEINHRTVDNTIVRIKKMIRDDQDQLIRSVRGVGYQWISP